MFSTYYLNKFVLMDLFKYCISAVLTIYCKSHGSEIALAILTSRMCQT